MFLAGSHLGFAFVNDRPPVQRDGCAWERHKIAVGNLVVATSPDVVPHSYRDGSGWNPRSHRAACGKLYVWVDTQINNREQILAFSGRIV